MLFATHKDKLTWLFTSLKHWLIIFCIKHCIWSQQINVSVSLLRTLTIMSSITIIDNESIFFPHKIIEKIIKQAIYNTLKHLCKKIKANATLVISNLGRGLHGDLGLIIPKSKHNNITRNKYWAKMLIVLFFSCQVLFSIWFISLCALFKTQANKWPKKSFRFYLAVWILNYLPFSMYRIL